MPSTIAGVFESAESKEQPVKKPESAIEMEPRLS